MKALPIALLTLALTCACAAAQTAPTAGPPAPPAAPATPITDETRAMLQMLHDRKNTLKDFTADIKYEVDEPRAGQTTGRVGKVYYIMDPAKGPIFSADFPDRTTQTPDQAEPTKQRNPSQIIFDGKELTAKDWGLDGNSKTFTRAVLLQPGDKPGSAVTLRGPLPLPIGIDVQEAIAAFDITSRPNKKDPNLVILKLVPHAGSGFDYKQLVITVDQKLQLPVTLEQTSPDKSVTTITFTNIEINTGKAKMLDASTPAAEGWKPKIESAPTAPGGQ